MNILYLEIVDTLIAPLDHWQFRLFCGHNLSLMIELVTMLSKSYIL